MTGRSAQVIRAGEDCWVEARNIVDVRTGTPIDVTSFTAHATARAAFRRFTLGQPQYALNSRYRMLMPVIGEWSNDPIGNQGTIAMGQSGPFTISIHITPEQTLNWRCPLVLLQCELKDPVTGYTSRVVDEVYELSFDVVTNP